MSLSLKSFWLSWGFMGKIIDELTKWFDDSEFDLCLGLGFVGLSSFPDKFSLKLKVVLESFSVTDFDCDASADGKYILGFLLNLSFSAMPKDDRFGSFRLKSFSKNPLLSLQILLVLPLALLDLSGTKPAADCLILSIFDGIESIGLSLSLSNQ